MMQGEGRESGENMSDPIIKQKAFAKVPVMDVLLQAGNQLASFGFVPPTINNSSPGTCEEGENGMWQKNCNKDKDAMETST